MASDANADAPPRTPTTETRVALYTRIRLATKTDVPHIHKLIHQMAIFEGLPKSFSATEESLSATLFNPPPFPPTTVLLLEVARAPFPSHAPPQSCIETLPISDPDEADFEAPGGGVVAGFVMYYPHYSAFSGKAGLTVEELLVREGYRRRGLGEMLVAEVAAEAVRLGFEKVEWTVLDWNGDAIRFYEKIGARILHKVKLCRLNGDALCSCARRSEPIFLEGFPK